MSCSDRQFLIRQSSAPYLMPRALETAEPVKDEFDRILLQAIDNGLLVFGENTRYVIYHHIARRHRIERERIPERLEAFHKALRDLLGEGGRIVETYIAKSMYGMFDLKFREYEEWTIVDYVDDVRKPQNLRQLGIPSGNGGLSAGRVQGVGASEVRKWKV